MTTPKKSPMQLRDRVAIVTGAASGIGRAIATSLAQRGCNVAIADRDEAGLAETAALLPSDVRISRHALDVADAAAVAALPASIQAEHGRVDILVNNAGVAVGGTFEQVSAEDFDWLFAINFHAVVKLTRAFLPVLKASDDARLVNVSSLFGLIAPPGQTAYVASKFAVRGFSESLRHELAATSVGVTVVHPGGVATSIARSARPPTGVDPAEAEKERTSFEAFLKMPPAEAGETIVKGVERRRPRIIVGNDAKVAALIERIAPVGYWSFLGRGRA